MKLNDEQTLLWPYCGNDDFRPSMWYPFFDSQLNAVCATDAHNLIIGDKDLFINEYAALEKPLHIKDVLPHEENTGIKISYKKLNECFDKIPYSKKHECPECNGYGRVDTTYQTKTGDNLSIEIECPICGGTGTVIGEERKDERYLIRIKDLCFRYKSMVVLEKTMENLHIEEARVLALTNSRLFVELLPGLKALYMCFCETEDLDGKDERKDSDLVIDYPLDKGGKKMNTLDLFLRFKWYDMIERGEKPEEYREITEYWCRRICSYGRVKRGFCKKNVCNIDCNCQLLSCKANVPTEITHVRFHRGYTKKTMIKEVAGISRGEGKAKWGAPDHETFIIKFA